jgi:hypothetical protein
MVAAIGAVFFGLAHHRLRQHDRHDAGLTRHARHPD